MTFPKVGLRFNEVCLERYPGLFHLRLGLPGSEVSLELSRFHDKAVCDADEFSFCDWLACCGRATQSLIQPQVEALKGLVGIVGFPYLLIVIGQVRCQYPRVVHVQVAQEGQRGGSRIAGERGLEGGEVCVLK